MGRNLPVDKKVKAKNDAYTGMLVISFLALVAGCILLFLDFQRYDYQTKAPKVQEVSPLDFSGGGDEGGKAKDKQQQQ